MKVKSPGVSHGVIDIHFTGIWDTVVALGFPKRTDAVSPVSWILKIAFDLFEKVADWVIPHSFYNYRLTDNQKYAYQALAIDDERTAFWPYVWDENISPDTVVEQVWFAGMHSNIGGGYNRSGLASIPLYWMMGKAQALGLGFENGTVDQARADSHVHGRMYNSRDGAAIFYRYHPRDIESLCRDDKDNSRFRDGKIKIYHSVIERMERRTANYTPGQIPGSFDMVEDRIQEDFSVATASWALQPVRQDHWDEVNCRIRFWLTVRKVLYDFMILFTLSIIIVAYHYWTSPPEILKRTGITGHIADIFDYILPDFFAGLIEIAVSQKPYLFLGALCILVVYIWIRSKARRKTVVACQQKRRLVMQAYEKRNKTPRRHLMGMLKKAKRRRRLLWRTPDVRTASTN